MTGVREVIGGTSVRAGICGCARERWGGGGSSRRLDIPSAPRCSMRHWLVGAGVESVYSRVRPSTSIASWVRH